MKIQGIWTARSGRGEPVLFLTGLGYSSWCWRDLLDVLAERIDAVRIDHRGTGRSDSPQATLTIQSMAEDAARVLESLGLHDAHIVGHSMGGYVAQSFALKFPSKVRSLVLIGTSSGGPDSVPVPEETMSAWQAAAHLSPEGYARATMPLSYCPGWTDRNPARFEAHLAARLAFPTPQNTWARQMAACTSFLKTGIAASRIQAPTLVLHGRNDRVVPLENGERVAASIAGARITILDGAGHLPFLETPSGVGDALLQHVCSIRGEIAMRATQVSTPIDATCVPHEKENR